MRNKKKVFMVCSVPLISGQAYNTHVLEVFRNLNKITDVYLFAPKLKNSFDEKKENIFFIPILTPRFLYVFYQIYLLFSLLRYCFSLSPDVIYERYSTSIFVPLLISKLLNIPYVVEVNGVAHREIEMSGGSVIAKVLTRLNQKISYIFSSKIIVVASDMKQEIIKRYNVNPNKISVVENGANVDLFTPSNKKEARRKLGLNENYIYIGFYGSFAPWHGLNNLVESSSLVLESSKKTKFLLVGDGVMKEEVRQKVMDSNLMDNFIFFDKALYLDIPKYVNTFDIGVILKEKGIAGSPLKLWEYMACGLPVVATISKDFNVLEKCDGGILVDPEKPEDVASALLTLIKNKKLREGMGRRNREYIYKYHSWNMVAKNVDMIFDEIISNLRS